VTPPARRRRWKIAAVALAVVLGIPSVMGLAAYVVLRHQIVSRYDDCVSALPEAGRDASALERMVAYFGAVPRYRDAVWNLNRPYSSGAINILVPREADATWHKACGLPEAPVDCIAAPSEKFVICNAALGRQLESQYLNASIVRPEVLYAHLFPLLTFLGHELGHLEESNGGLIQHLYPNSRPDGLRCLKTPDADTAIERRADAFGVQVACEAVRADASQIMTKGSPILAIQQYRDSLDEDFFAFDDACHENARYPSISRRKSSFARAYAQCIFSDRQLPFADLADDQDEAFQHLEEWLASRQVTGIVGSALYGIDATYRYEVAGTPSQDAFIAFDSSGRRSQISHTVVTVGAVTHKVLAEWANAGEPVLAKGDATGADFLLSFAGENQSKIESVHVDCATAAVPCLLDRRSRNIPSDDVLQGTSSGSLVEKDGSRLRTFVGPRDFVAGASALDVTLPPEMKDGSWIVDGTASTLLLTRAVGDGEIPSGFSRVGVVDREGIHWKVLSTVGSTMNPILAMAVRDETIAFVFASDSALSAGVLQVWLCPRGDLISPTTSVRNVRCDAYEEPKDLRFSIGLANNDLESLGTSFHSPQFCGALLVLRTAGWLWALAPGRKAQDVCPGTGIVGCDPVKAQVTIYRAHRIDVVRQSFSQANPNARTITVLDQ
jgi:hypothetical protein